MTNDIAPILDSQKITIAYDQSEDRLILHCGLIDQSSASFYLTYRFTRILVNYFLKNSPIDGLLDTFKVELGTELPKYIRVPSEATYTSEQSSTENRLQSGAKQIFIIIDKCDISFCGKSGVALIFDLHRDSPPRQIKLTLSKEHLVKFLVGLYIQTQVAEWNIPMWEAIPPLKHNIETLTLH